MDCIDCHNASGHPFPNPANLVDEAIHDGRISREPADRQGARSDGDHREVGRHRRPGKGARGEVRRDHRRVGAEGRQPAASKAARRSSPTQMQQILMLTSFAATNGNR